ncbi:hypothetical protein MNBD_GAMMA09-908 [hydrothermal vent metagenome]|uniref:Flagellar protein n=1 Tax=hydrothermal vent metagenome TaxID=652676 RepID=A0A3B0XMW0_9ZZZZ
MNNFFKNIKYLIFLISILPEVVISGVEAQAPVTTANIDAFSLMSVLNMLMGLVVVVALILGLAWILKKYGKLANYNQADMKILGGLSLGSREKALLIEVDNVRLLVGVSPGHIQTLHVLNDGADKGAPSFDKTLNKIVDQTDE